MGPAELPHIIILVPGGGESAPQPPLLPVPRKCLQGRERGLTRQLQAPPPPPPPPPPPELEVSGGQGGGGAARERGRAQVHQHSRTSLLAVAAVAMGSLTALSKTSKCRATYYIVQGQLKHLHINFPFLIISNSWCYSKDHLYPETT